MLDALMEKGQKKEEGMRILNNIRVTVAQAKLRDQEDD